MTQLPARLIRWSCAASSLWLAPAVAVAQAPALEPPAEQPVVCQRRGPIHRMLHHSAHTLQDKFVGYPATFIEPPLGYYLTEQFTVQVSKADPHRFMLYHTDFLPGTAALSPTGASRFNLMCMRLPGWIGPITVEWTPEQPALAQARRTAVLANLEQLRLPVVPERVVIAPSPYPGARGVEAIENNNNTILRNQIAAPTFPPPPAETASSGVR